MNATDIGQYRLIHQQIASPRAKTAAEVVATLGAMQAQDFSGAVWSVGARLKDAKESDVERAIAERSIVRTWPVRGTLHLVAATDVHWMLALLTPRVIANSAHRRRALELDDKIFARCGKLFLRALQGDQQLERDAMLQLLEREKISTASQRGDHILWRLALDGVICFGSRSGKQHTFALLDEWVKKPKPMEREAALAELALRYFTSHGPVTLQDFVGWAGLKVSDARAGLESVSPKLSQHKIDGTDYWMPRDLPDKADASTAVHLLAGFDEFILGYKDRSTVLDKRHAQKIIPGNNGMFMPTIIVNGRVAGTWKRAIKKKAVVIEAYPFVSFKKAEKDALAQAAGRYGNFIGLPAEVKISPVV